MWEKIEAILKEKQMTEAELLEQLSSAGKLFLKRTKSGNSPNPPYVRVCEITRILGVKTDDIIPDDY